MWSRPECPGACLGSHSPRRMAGTSWIRPELAWTCGCMQADCLAKSNVITCSLAIGWGATVAIVPVCHLGMQRTADAEIHGAAMRWLAKWWPCFLGVSFTCRGLQENLQ